MQSTIFCEKGEQKKSKNKKFKIVFKLLFFCFFSYLNVPTN